MTRQPVMFASFSGIAAHSRYVLQDFLLLRAPLTVIGSLIIGSQFVYSARRFSSPKGFADPRFIAGAHSTYVAVSAVMMFITMILAVVAIMTVDRTTGYYRFFFSKPVNLVHYYLHTLGVHGAAACALLCVGALAWGTALPHESVYRAAEVGMLGYALVGGVGFALGALTNLDAALTPLAFIFAASTSGVLADYAQGKAPLWLVTTGKALPPVMALKKSGELLYDGRPLDLPLLAPVLLWGAVTWALGMIFLRWRPLAR